MFLLGAIAQERLSVPIDGKTSDKFKSAIFIGSVQSALSSVSRFVYIPLRRKPTDTFMQSLGLEHVPEPAAVVANGTVNGHAHAKHPEKPSTRFSRSNLLLLLHYLQCSTFFTFATPFGFTALFYISYPAMVLGKSCKLVLVMIMNVPAAFLHCESILSCSWSLLALPSWALLLINLALDGAVNSTQDKIFACHRVTGAADDAIGQYLLYSAAGRALRASAAVYPRHPPYRSLQRARGCAGVCPHAPVDQDPIAAVWADGPWGQLFIFETLRSLTLVTVALTRKMFTMLLSVIVYNYKPNAGQLFGVVFAAIIVEAFVKGKDVHILTGDVFEDVVHGVDALQGLRDELVGGHREPLCDSLMVATWRHDCDRVFCRSTWVCLS
ncbi:hypothetical protein MVEN_00200800 [Mycena venus]|uniref:UDP-galactose transporter homolog 1 n=1 Tax=Mycena venus TaxID=2733690 RepID=A0A8H7DDA7_9AGAR|nr:hypothetical protein MVEN_00200800 [Mycena venus]